MPAIVALSVINACYTNIAMSVAFSRDRGVLKRLRGTPLPPLVFFAGRILQTMGVTMLLVVIVVAFGVVFYGVDMQTEKLPAFVVALVVGAGGVLRAGPGDDLLHPQRGRGAGGGQRRRSCRCCSSPTSSSRWRTRRPG